MASSTPLVYACSGCSNVAQLANECALALDAQGLAEMSCIAGIGGKVSSLVRKAQTGRPIIALDGCALRCCQHCLAGIGVQADTHIVLSDLGFRKRKLHVTAISDEQRHEALQAVCERLEKAPG